ncbi:glycosyltransferase family 4 protein [Pontibacter anaerobius]|uniref:Glycosyltransferase family 4 protein n=1 Tax=Pontibacter anaerobius TaxID=2993940 RepID=A0ABT3RDK9_9BACT|nr:glycosyltransferase family 4 protein [Pontibacter anaerobius]MCX2739937.1 glycosyltransferase family 4 protein [Pontibacter anaerobius]
MKLLFVLELGLLHYRIPILEQIARDDSVEKCDVLHTETHTNSSYAFIELKSSPRYYGKFRFLPEVRALKDAYDVVVFSFNLWMPNWIFTFFSNRKPKYILWGQGFGRENNYWAARLARISFAKWADGLILYTAKGAEDFLEYGIPREKLFVAKNTLHIGNAGRSGQAQKTDLLYVGRIQKRKGIDLLLKAFCKVKDNIPEYVRVRVVGSGDKTELLEQVNTYGLQGRVMFNSGVFDEEQLKNIFSTAIAYVSPDHVGLGVVHSFAYGVPVVTNKNRKHAPEVEYCDSSNSILYEGGVEQLALELERICTDSNLQGSLSEASYAYYDKNLRSEIMINGFLQAFRYVTTGPGKAVKV